MSFAEQAGTLSESEMDILHTLASRAQWRGIRGYLTAEVSDFWEPCKRSFFVKIPPKGQIHRHSDSVPGITHHLVLQTNPGCLNWWLEDGEERSIHLESGSRYVVQRDPVHWATNEGETDRIHLLVEYG